jgi:hypothetical protein
MVNEGFKEQIRSGSRQAILLALTVNSSDHEGFNFHVIYRRGDAGFAT